MSSHNKSVLALLVASLAGCGQQLVEFGNTSIPTVVSTDPASGATNVALNKTVSANFSEAMNAATISATTFTLAQGSTAIPGAVTYSGTTATFTPAAALTSGTFTATIGAAAASAASGSHLAADYSWSFTTVGAVAGPPVVSSTDPGNNAVGVATNKQLAAIFSKAMDPATINTTTFTLKQGATAVAGAVTYSGTTAKFAPTSALASGVLYTATVSTGAKDATGLALAANYSWSFTTGAVAPAVTIVDPANGAIGVPVNKKVSAAFSESMDCATITGTSFTLQQGATAVPGAVACTGTSATFTPTSNLAPSTVYSAALTTAIKDPAGNALPANFTWTFTTVSGTPPIITFINPSDGAVGVCPNEVVRATFNGPMDQNTIVAANFTLANAGVPVNGVVSYDDPSRTASFKSTADLPTNTMFTATVTTGVKDVSGNALANNKVWRFTTGTMPCQPPVNLRSLSTFVAVAGAGLTNSNSGGTTVLNGDVGLSPTATCMGDGSPCSAVNPVINGTFYANDPAGVAAAAKADLTSAYNDAIGRPPGVTVNDLSGLTLTPGVYSSGSTMSIAVGGTLVLDAQGDANGVWIFQVGSSLTVNQSAKVLLVNGAKAGNVFWAIFASSTLGGGVSFKGSVLAGASNSVGTGSTVEGRLLCRTGQITLLSNTITLPAP